VRLRINSPGGDVFEARTMMAAMADHPAKFTARIDGLCASAATSLTLPCDSIEIADGGFYMIHNAWSMVIGNACDMRETANLLDKVDASIIDGYAQRSGKPADQVQAWMAEETWFDADEAVDQGFCDSVFKIPVGGAAAQARAGSHYNLAAYSRAPKALTEPPVEQPDPEINRKRMLARLRLYEMSST